MNYEKYLLPWIEVKIDFLGKTVGENSALTGLYRRPRLTYPTYPEGAWLSVYRDQLRPMWFSAGHNICFPTAQEAMAAYDKILLEQGYVFLTEEQANKLMLLI